jgi:hypothetical protein
MTRSAFTASMLVLALTASPCVAVQGVAHPPMTVTRIDGRSVDPVIAFLETAGTNSMLADAVLITMAGIHAVAAPPPPAQYDKPYPNAEIVHDLPWDGGAWGLTELPARKGGRCVIHLAPLGSASEEEAGIELLEPVGLPRLLRHEMGHCWGLIHGADGKDNDWFETDDATRKQIAAIVRQQVIEIPGQHDEAPVSAHGTRSPPRREITPRSFSGDGY